MIYEQLVLENSSTIAKESTINKFLKEGLGTKVKETILYLNAF